MKIILDSPINKYYVQTLGMIFFPGEHFAENEDIMPGEPVLSVRTQEEEQGVRAFATVAIDDKSESALLFAIQQSFLSPISEHSSAYIVNSLY